MLLELAIADFAIIDRLRLGFEPGFNVMTGETGAGKSIIVDALGGLLGARLGAEVVRAEAEQSRIEGIFALGSVAGGPLAALVEQIGEEFGIVVEDDVLILSSEINRNGRSIARVNGRAVPVQALRRIGEVLVDVHGQSEHLSLLRPAQHVDFLDRFGRLLEPRASVADLVGQLRGVRREIERLTSDERELARRVDLLQFQVEEIGSAGLQLGEDDELEAERTLLANSERLTALADRAYGRLYESPDGQPTVLDGLGEVVAAVGELADLDPALGELAASAQLAADQLDDLARQLRRYRDAVEDNPARLEQVEERLDLIRRLKRKYGGSIAEILRFGDEVARELNQISRSEERLGELQAEEARLLRAIGEVAAELSACRREAGDRLARAIEAELDELNMSKARFAVRMDQVEAAEGAPHGERRLAFDATGIDRVEFLISPNPGEPLKPLAKIASGGETSRLMLALKTILAEADVVPTLVFDEIDVGIGGRTGQIVGEKMWRLGRTHQVIAITHLPQTACYGDAHFQIRKQIAGGRTTTVVSRLSAAERVEELAQMLGDATETTRRSAAELLERAVGNRR